MDPDEPRELHAGCRGGRRVKLIIRIHNRADFTACCRLRQYVQKNGHAAGRAGAGDFGYSATQDAAAEKWDCRYPKRRKLRWDFRIKTEGLGNRGVGSNIRYIFASVPLCLTLLSAMVGSEFLQLGIMRHQLRRHSDQLASQN
jgi:hypothetical protein